MPERIVVDGAKTGARLASPVSDPVTCGSPPMARCAGVRTGTRAGAVERTERRTMGKKKNDTTHTVHTRFELDAPMAHRVFVAGSFNAWKPEATSMTRKGAGRWLAEVAIAPGRHEYKFLVDGRWCCGVGPDGPTECVATAIPNDRGSMNLVLEVAP